LIDYIPTPKNMELGFIGFFFTRGVLLWFFWIFILSLQAYWGLRI
jgi:hypothetical protein